MQQQAGGDVGVVGVALNQRARGQDGGLVHLGQRHTVVQVAQGFGHDGRGADVGIQVVAGGTDQRLQSRLVQRDALAVIGHVQRRLGGCCRSSFFGRLFLGGGAFLVACFAVEHIGARYILVASAHQGQLHMVLHVFDVEGATFGARAQQGAHHGVGECFDGFANAGRCCALRATHCQECFGHGNRNFLRCKWHHITAAANDLVLIQHGWNAAGTRCPWRCQVGVRAIHSVLHEGLLVQVVGR